MEEERVRKRFSSFLVEWAGAVRGCPATRGTGGVLVLLGPLGDVLALAVLQS